MTPHNKTKSPNLETYILAFDAACTEDDDLQWRPSELPTHGKLDVRPTLSDSQEFGNEDKEN